MTDVCQPLPRSLGEEMLQVVARAICDRPGDTKAQRDSLTRQMVYSILGAEPRDGLELMLAGVIVGHFHAILDSLHDLASGQPDAVKAKTRTTLAALDRAMLGMFRELRLLRKRPPAVAAEETPAEVDSPAKAARPAPEMPEAEVTEPDAVQPAKADRMRARRGGHRSDPGVSAPATDVGQDTAPPEPRPSDFIRDLMAHPPPCEDDGATFEQRVAAYQAALTAAMETLAEGKALEEAEAEPVGEEQDGLSTCQAAFRHA